MSSDVLALFDEHRPRVFAIAYRMLGTVADAEDMVQETFLRWRKADPAGVKSAEAWLSTVVTRLCINQLKSARRRREEYVGPWLPEPLLADDSADPRESLEQADSISMAFLVVLETLAPTERAVFLLREVFAYDFAEIARIVRKTEANCRQLLSRARERVAQRRPRFKSTLAQQERLVGAFIRATESGDAEAFLRILSEDVSFISDGGPNARALRRPIQGIDPVLRVLTHEAPRVQLRVTARRRVRINGQPGVIVYFGVRPHAALVFDTDRERIRGIYLITNPDKLKRLPSAAA